MERLPEREAHGKALQLRRDSGGRASPGGREAGERGSGPRPWLCQGPAHPGAGRRAPGAGRGVAAHGSRREPAWGLNPPSQPSRREL